MITKEEFEIAYRKFPPSKIEMFFIKYVSIISIYDNKITIAIISLFLIFPFIVQFLFHLLNFSKPYKLIPSFIYVFVLAILGIFGYIVWHKKTKRYNNIRVYLGVSKEEYKSMINMYYYNQYPSAKDFILNCWLNKTTNKK